MCKYLMHWKTLCETHFRLLKFHTWSNYSNFNKRKTSKLLFVYSHAMLHPFSKTLLLFRPGLSWYSPLTSFRIIYHPSILIYWHYSYEVQFFYKHTVFSFQPNSMLTICLAKQNMWWRSYVIRVHRTEMKI